VFVGYFIHHEKDVYRMLNLDTKSIIQLRSIIWLNGAYHDWIENEVLQNREEEEVDNDDDDDDVIANSKIWEVHDGQNKLRISKDQHELYKRLCVC
jgi:hypothetical protein